MAFATVDEAIEDFKNGKMVVVVDESERRNTARLQSEIAHHTLRGGKAEFAG